MDSYIYESHMIIPYVLFFLEVLLDWKVYKLTHFSLLFHNKMDNTFFN